MQDALAPGVPPPAGVPAPRRLLAGSPYGAALLVGLAGCLLYAVSVPHVPDLAAQVARSSLARTAGVADWWVGWFGGLQLPTYSVLAPSIIAAIGPPAAGTIAVVAATVAFADLVMGMRRAASASVAFALLAVLDVVAGRLTFALAFACGLAALAALKRRHWGAVPVAVLTCLLGLLAAFFLGVAAVAVVATDRTRRLHAAFVGGAVLVVALAIALLYRQTGTMPFGHADLIGASATALVVAWLVPDRRVRAGALLMAAVTVATMVVPGALGENVVRLSWFTAAPLLIAGSRLRGWLLVVAVVAVAAWPVGDSVRQVLASTDASASAAFYQPLIREIRSQQRHASPQALGERLEVIPTSTHWETSYLTGTIALARGWDRQADVRNDPLFYTRGLTAAAYQQWLRDMAVGWVARPHAQLDPAGVAEAQLVDAGLPYLRLVWHTAQWDLYRVRDAGALAVGARVEAVQPTDVVLDFRHAGSAFVRLRWTPDLVAAAWPAATGAEACARPDGAFTSVTVEAPGRYLLSTDFRVGGRSCPP